MQLITDIKTNLMKRLQSRIISKEGENANKEDNVNADMFYIKLFLYIIQICINVCLIILQFYFTNLFQQYPLLGISIMPALFMFSNIRCKQYFLFRLELSKRYFGEFITQISKIV